MILNAPSPADDPGRPWRRSSRTSLRAPTAAAAAALAAALALLGAEPARAAPRLDPFRSSGASAPSWNPIRTARQANAAQDPGQAPAQNQTPAPAAQTPAAATPEAAPKACKADTECPVGTICENGFCKPFERPIHAFIYRKEGAETAVYPLYFSRRGNPGYRIFAPFYWHFWSPQDKSKIFAPFYWRFEDYVKQRVVVVVPPFSYTRQPDAFSWAVWPIIYQSTKFGWAAPLLLSFKIANPDEGRSFGLLALLYFWKRDTKAGTAFDLFFPFFVSSRSRPSTFTWALPLNFYWRRNESKHLLALPLFYRSSHPEGGTTVSLLGYAHRSGENSAGSVLWLYWWGRERGSAYDLGIPLFYWSRHDKGGTLGSLLGYYSRNGRNIRGSALWVYWFGRSADESKYDVVLPLFWSWRSPTSNTTFLPLPPILHVRRGSWALSTLLPIYWAGRDYDRGTAWRLLFPLYFSRTGEGGRTFSWFTPLGGYRRDDALGTRTLALWLPPFIYRRDASRELDMILGLFWRYRNKDSGATTWLVGPYYRGQDPNGSTTAIFPLFWHFHDAASGATAHTLLPLYFRRSSPTESTTAFGVLPVWAYYRSFRAGGWSAGLTPLAFFGSTPERGHGVLFPLFWHFRDKRSTATVAAPFFYRFADRRTTTAGVPPLLYFYGREDQDRYHIQIPLFWRFVNGKTGSATTVIPPLFWQSGKEGWSTGLFPLLFAGSGQKRGHFVLFPLFWRFRDSEADRHTTVVLNYMHRRHGGETTDAFFPLVYFRRGARPGGADQTGLTVFPLLHYQRTDKRTLFASLPASWTRSADLKAGYVVPYFWYQSRSVAARGVPPLWFDFTKLGTGERTRVFGPWIMVDGPENRARVLFPLFGTYRDADERGTWIFPSLFRRRTNDGYAVDTFLPFFWWSRGQGRSATVVGPWFQRTAPDRYATGLIPLFVYSRNPERRMLVTPVSYWRDSKDGTGKLFAGLLFYRTRRPDGHTTVLFPLYWGGRTGPRSYSVLFPLAWMFGNDETKSYTNLVGPFYWSRTGDKQRTRGIMPLAWYSRDEERGTASHALLPLFYERHGPRQLTVLTLPFGFKSEPDRRWWYALNVFRRETVGSSFTMVFPLWFSHFDKITETSTRVIPPLLHFSRSRPDRSLSGWLMLFWAHRDVSSSTTLALPLYYDIHSYHQSRVTLLAPLFFRYWRAEDDTAYTYALPAFYRRSSPDSSTTVLFPLYWDFASADRRTTVALPFYVGIRRPTHVSRFIFPTIYYRKGLGPETGTSRLFVFPFWESAVKRPGDYMWEVLLGLFGWERIGRNRFVKLLYLFDIALEPLPAAQQTSWYGRQPPKAVRQRRYGLDTRAW